MKKRKLPLALRITAIVVAAVLVIAIAYVAYVFIDYHRVPDNQPLEIARQADAELKVQPGQTYKAVAYNIGFGAYTPDFSFFMDGGTQSWAASKESVQRCTDGAGDLMAQQQADFVMFEEMDRNSTRSWHVDQKAMMDSHFPGYDSVFAVNYDSPFLFYPFTQPHGKSYSGLALYSRFPAHDALRRSLPITTSVTKLIDLDRCYMSSHIDMADGRELVIFTIHMTAYTSDASIRDSQLAMLLKDMSAEYAKGNAVICGGDFNMEMLSTVIDEHTAEWALPLDRAALGQFANAWDVAAEKKHPIGTCRDTGDVYKPGQTTEWTVDSFIVSPNVTVETIESIDNGYTFSDHNPVAITFHIN